MMEPLVAYNRVNRKLVNVHANHLSKEEVVVNAKMALLIYSVEVCLAAKVCSGYGIFFKPNNVTVFICVDCDCDIGGSINPVCNKQSGQCKCHPRIAGRTCSHPLTTHYYPTLYQNQFEFEDGYTPTGANVRYQYEESQFPNFSKRGYAKFSTIQSEVISEVNIIKSSFYRMVIRYVNPTDENIIAQILITSENPSEVDQQ